MENKKSRIYSDSFTRQLLGGAILVCIAVFFLGLWLGGQNADYWYQQDVSLEKCIGRLPEKSFTQEDGYVGFAVQGTDSCLQSNGGYQYAWPMGTPDGN